MACFGLARPWRFSVLAARVTGPPVTEREQWALAHHYVEKHGDEAPIAVALRADELLSLGEILSANTYVSIIRKSEQLLTRNYGSVH